MRNRLLGWYYATLTYAAFQSGYFLLGSLGTICRSPQKAYALGEFSRQRIVESGPLVFHLSVNISLSLWRCLCSSYLILQHDLRSQLTIPGDTAIIKSD
jgi:hypothetical protein